MRNKLKTILSNQYLPFMVFGIGMLLLHFAVPIPIGDDIWFGSVPSDIFDLNFFSERYFGWTSRILIEFILIAFLHIPSGIWRFTNTGVLVLLVFSISKLLEDGNKQINNLFIVFLLFIYPLKQISDAGWVTTTINYLWPLALGLYAMIVIRKILLSRHVKPYQFVLSSIALIIAVNNEVVCMVLLITLSVITIYQIKIKSVHWFVLLSMLICLASMIFILTTPGNALRRIAEMRWFTDFDQLSIINKVEIGLSSTLSHYLFNFNLVFFGFCLLLFLSVNHKYQDPLYKLFSVIPLIVVSVFGIAPRFVHFIPTFQSQLTKYGFITSSNFSILSSYIPVLILCFTFILILISLYLIFGNSYKSLLAISILIIGFLTRMILILSPTIWASGLRTHFFMFVSIIMCSTIIFQDLIITIPTKLTICILTIFGIMAFISYIHLFITLEVLLHMRNIINIYILSQILAFF